MVDEEISKTNENFERYRERITNFSNEFELGLFLFVAKKSIIYIFLILIFAVVLAFMYIRYSAPIYESKALIQINSNNVASAVLGGNLSNVGSKGGLNSKVELLRSEFLMKKALKKMP